VVYKCESVEALALKLMLKKDNEKEDVLRRSTILEY
jgi:hypothetical protein